MIGFGHGQAKQYTEFKFQYSSSAGLLCSTHGTLSYIESISSLSYSFFTLHPSPSNIVVQNPKFLAKPVKDRRHDSRSHLGLIPGLVSSQYIDKLTYLLMSRHVLVLRLFLIKFQFWVSKSPSLGLIHLLIFKENFVHSLVAKYWYCTSLGETESESNTWRRLNSWSIPSLSEAEIRIQKRIRNQRITSTKSNLHLTSLIIMDVMLFAHSSRIIKKYHN